MPMRIDIERFAEISAELEAGAALDDLLLAEEVDRDAWEEGREEWLEKLGEEAAKRRTALTERYTAAFAARLAIVAARPPKVSLPVPERQPTPLPAEPPPSLPVVPAPTGDATPLPLPSSSLGRTVDGALSPFAQPHGVMPFTRPTSPAAPLSPRAVPVRKDTGTAALPVMGTPVSSPTSDPQYANPPMLSLEQLASLAAELSLDAGASATVLARWGFTAAEHAATLRAWRTRFDRDLAEYERFKQLYEHYRAWYWSARHRG